MANNFNNFEQPTIGIGHLNTSQAIFEHQQDILNSNKKPVNGVLDKFDEVRLRVGIIDNYLIKRNGQPIDPLDEKNIINMSNGYVVIKWATYNGGVIRPDEFGYPNGGYTEPWTYYPDKDSKYPEKRTLDCYNHDKASEKEMIPLTHSFIWSNGKNWCGMNHLPPIGSVVIVGFEKNNTPAILGYVQTDYINCKPYLKLGETMIKGYGENYIHWRWSDKMDVHLNTQKGKIDVDDPYKQDTYPADLDIWVRYDCFTRSIFIDVNQHDASSSGRRLRTTVEIKPEHVNVTCKDLDRLRDSMINISTDDIYAVSNKPGESTSVYMNPSKIDVISSDSSNSSSVHVNPNKINIISDGIIDINSKGGVNINSENGIQTNSKDIILTSTGNIAFNAGGSMSSTRLINGGYI